MVPALNCILCISYGAQIVVDMASIHRRSVKADYLYISAVGFRLIKQMFNAFHAG